MKIKQINYENKAALQIENHKYEMIIPLTYGLRILSFRHKEDRNFLGENIDITKKHKDETWYIRGGHRLWHTPEVFPRTYLPDNDPIEYFEIEEGIRVKQKTNPKTGIEKSIDISFCNDGEKVKLKHRLKNKGQWPIETSAWAITILRTGGIAKVPINTRKDPLLHTKAFAVWSYCHLGDDRIEFYEDCFTLKQDINKTNAFKIGTNNEAGWASYTEGGFTFKKEFEYVNGECYPDHGCSFETYTNDKILELETLSPIQTIKPGESIVHEEKWMINQV